jgi:hypothetical protein
LCNCDCNNHRQIFGLFDDNGQFPGPALNEILKPLTHKPSKDPDYTDVTFEALLKKNSKKRTKDASEGDEEGEELEAKAEEVVPEEDLLDKQKRVSMRLKAMFPGGLPEEEEEDQDVQGEQEGEDEQLGACRDLGDFEVEADAQQDGDDAEYGDTDQLENDLTDAAVLAGAGTSQPQALVSVICFAVCFHHRRQLVPLVSVMFSNLTNVWCPGLEGVPSRPPIPKDGQPGFIGIDFIDPLEVYQGRVPISA